jgi:transcriptional regulator with PAS, ATPase and Fis domain
VRELENIIEFAYVVCHNGLIDVRHLPAELQGAAQYVEQSDQSASRSRLELAEANAIRAVLRQMRGHLGRTAEELEISRATLWRKMKKHAIRARDYRRKGRAA